jgi:hypothetical protein
MSEIKPPAPPPLQPKKNQEGGTKKKTTWIISSIVLLLIIFFGFYLSLIASITSLENSIDEKIEEGLEREVRSLKEDLKKEISSDLKETIKTSLKAELLAELKKKTSPSKQETTEQASQPKSDWREVLKLSSKGTKTSPKFEITGSEWRITYTHKGSGNFVIDVERPDGEYVDMVGNIIGNGSDTSYLYETGFFVLRIIGDNWTVKVEENTKK